VQILDGTLTVNETVIYAELDDEAVLLNVESGVYFGLDPIGSQIWRMLERGLSLGEIVRRLLDEYEVESEALKLDVMEFVAKLETQGLVRADEG